MNERPWYKVTFDPAMPGTALVSNFPRRGASRDRGRWVVFDKNGGVGPIKSYWSGLCLFDAETFEECCAWITAREKEECAA